MHKNQEQRSYSFVSQLVSFQAVLNKLPRSPKTIPLSRLYMRRSRTLHIPWGSVFSDKNSQKKRKKMKPKSPHYVHTHHGPIIITSSLFRSYKARKGGKKRYSTHGTVPFTFLWFCPTNHLIKCNTSVCLEKGGEKKE